MTILRLEIELSNLSDECDSMDPEQARKVASKILNLAGERARRIERAATRREIDKVVQAIIAENRAREGGEHD